MRLKNLYIEQYKNLKNFTIDFESGNGISILIGNNGSGKSNVLEAISGVFHDLFKEKANRKIRCDYTLKYILNDINCTIEQKNGVLRCYSEKFKRRELFIERNAPSNIIGLYSGEEDRLWTTFYEAYYKAYIRRIKTNRHQERMRLMLINKYYWNIALLTLLLSNNDTLLSFIEDELGIFSISKITISFNFKTFEKTNELLKSFIERINPEHNLQKEYSLDELKRLIFVNELTDELGNILTDEKGNIFVVDSGITDIEVFRYLTQANMPKHGKIITNISIHINDDITIQHLSEGEKKLILVKSVLEILADEKTLVLMDEPDAHLHEDRKFALLELMREYSNRQIVAATHSPIMAQSATDKELIMLENECGKTSVIAEDKIEKIKRLSGTSWDVIGQVMALKSNRPLVIFEGKTDVMYVKRALEAFKHTSSQYTSLKVDFLNANGAGNMISFVNNLKDLVSSQKKIIVFFDRDNAGKDGAHGITGISKHDERIVNFQDIRQDNITVSFIPYKEEIVDGDFLIEDYFSWEGTIKAIVEDSVPLNKHPIKNLPNLPAKIKSEIERRFSQFTDEEFNGFIPLLNKIVELSQETQNE